MSSNPKRRDNINKLREKYATIITKTIERLLENYLSLLKSASVENEHSTNDASNFRIKIHAANISQASEHLIQTIVELRYLILLNDFPTLLKETKESKTAFHHLHQETESSINHLRNEISEMIHKLDVSYQDGVLHGIAEDY